MHYKLLALCKMVLFPVPNSVVSSVHVLWRYCRLAPSDQYMYIRFVSLTFVSEKPKNAGDIRKFWSQGTTGGPSSSVTKPPGTSSTATNPGVPGARPGGVVPSVKPGALTQPKLSSGGAPPNLPTLPPGEVRGPRQASGIWGDEEPIRTSGMNKPGSGSTSGGRTGSGINSGSNAVSGSVSNKVTGLSGSVTGGKLDGSSGNRVPGVSNIHGFGGKVSSGGNTISGRTDTSGLNTKEITPSWRVAHGSNKDDGDDDCQVVKPETGPKFTGGGQRLGRASNATPAAGNVIVRRIPGIGIITSARPTAPTQNTNDRSGSPGNMSSLDDVKKNLSVNHNGICQELGNDKITKSDVGNGGMKRKLNDSNRSHQTKSVVAVSTHQSNSSLASGASNSTRRSSSDACPPEPKPFGDSDSDDDLLGQAARLDASIESQKSLIDISDSDDDVIYKRCPKKIKKADMDSSADLNSSFKVSGLKSVSNRSFNRDDMAGCRSTDADKARHSSGGVKERLRESGNVPAKPREVYKRVNAVDRNKRALALDSSDSDSCDEFSLTYKRRKINAQNRTSQLQSTSSASASNICENTSVKKRLSDSIISSEKGVIQGPASLDRGSLSGSPPAPDKLSTANSNSDEALQTCPVCQIQVPAALMNPHLDECLQICWHIHVVLLCQFQNPHLDECLQICWQIYVVLMCQFQNPHLDECLQICWQVHVVLICQSRNQMQNRCISRTVVL